MVGAQGMGHEHREAARYGEGPRRGRQQACGHHAPHVVRSYEFRWNNAPPVTLRKEEKTDTRLTKRALSSPWGRRARQPRLESRTTVSPEGRETDFNEPFVQRRSLKAVFPFLGLNTAVKIGNILTVRDGVNAEYVIYAYFSPLPVLSDNAARLGLWLLFRALSTVPIEEIRISDVIRGRTFSVDRNPLVGTEEEEFRQRYSATLDERAVLRREYP